MAIQAVCACGKPLRFKDEAAGRRAKCPACGAMLTVPGRAAAEPADSDNLASALEIAAATEKTAARVPAAKAARTKAAPTTTAKVILMAILGVVGAAATVGIIIVACMLATGPVKPAGKAASPAAAVSVPPAPESPAAPAPAAPAAEPPESPVTPLVVASPEPAAPAAAPPTAPAPVEPAAPAPVEPLAAEAPMAAVPPPEVVPAGPNLPPEKEQEALRLLKKCTSVSVSYTTSSAVEGADKTDLDRAAQFAQTFVLRKGPADGLRPAAEEVAKFRASARFIITVLAEAGPDLEQIRKIVGKESRTEAKAFYRRADPDARSRARLVDTPEPTNLPVTWRHYGWLAFGEAGGRVVAVRADCRRLQGADSPAAPEAAAAPPADREAAAAPPAPTTGK